MRTATLASVLMLGLAVGLSVEAAAPVPRPSKEFAVVTRQGQQILLSSLKGKVVVVQFLYTWCPHCQAFSKVLTQVNAEYSARGFQALGVAFDDLDPKDPVPLKDKAVAYSQQHAGFPVGISSRSPVLSYLGISEIERIGVPQIVVIDKKGVIREQTSTQGGGALGDVGHLKPLIESLLAEGAPAKAPASGEKKATDKKAEKKTSE